MTFNEKESIDLSIEFFKAFNSKDIEQFKELNYLYNIHYINTKKYGEDWILSFEKNIRKIFSSKNFNTNFISIICNSLNPVTFGLVSIVLFISASHLTYCFSLQLFISSSHQSQSFDLSK